MKFGLNKEGLLFPKVKTKVLGVNKNKHEGIFCEGILEIDVQYASNVSLHLFNLKYLSISSNLYFF